MAIKSIIEKIKTVFSPYIDNIEIAEPDPDKEGLVIEEAGGVVTPTNHRDLMNVLPTQHHSNTNDPTTDQKAAMTGANSPAAGNVFATMSDVGGGGAIVPATFVVAASNSKDTSRADYVCDGVADQVQINQAITALSLGSGGRIVLLEGTYNISDSINITDGLKKMITLEGCGFNTWVQVQSGSGNFNLINISPGGGVCGAQIKNLNLQGNWSNAVKAIYLSGVNYSIIENCYIKGFNYGIYHRNCSRIIITKNNFYINDTHIYIIGSISTAPRYHIISSNILSGGAEGIYIANEGHSYYETYTTICSNNLKDLTSHGIYITGLEGCECNHCVLSNNIINECGGVGIKMDFGNYNMISMNSITESDEHGIFLASSNNNIINGNMLFDNNRDNGNFDGINIGSNSDRNSIQGNLVRQGSYQRYGIRINDANCDDNFVTNNDLKGAGATADLSDNGTGTITVAGNRT